MTPNEYRHLSALISVLGEREAQQAAQNYLLDMFIREVQGR